MVGVASARRIVAVMEPVGASHPYCLMHLNMHLSDRHCRILADGLLYLAGIRAICDDGGGNIAARGGGGCLGGNLP